jgi:pimeloyl-ACP methyl ester carboxylesterase
MNNDKISVVFLHGFFSSSKSSKFEYFKTKDFKFNNIALEFLTFDLYSTVEEFEQMTIDSLLIRIDEFIDNLNGKVILMGSSHGGLLATNYALNYPKKLYGTVLLAPALKFDEILALSHDITDWKIKGSITIDNYLFGTKTKLTWEYYESLQLHCQFSEKIQVPVLLIHGTQDESVPISHSEEFVINQNELGADITYKNLKGGLHDLSNVMEELENDFQAWIEEKIIQL